MIKAAKLTPAEIQTYPVLHDPDRKVNPDVWQKYDIRARCSEQTGLPDTLYYPYFSDGAITGYKVRELPKKWSVSGSIESLFGEQLANPTQGHLILTEGEEDCLAAKTMLLPTSKVDVMSLPNGASLDKVVRSKLELFAKYKTVYLCFDQDDPGKAAANDIARWLCGEVTTKIVELDPAIGKDASDYCVNGKSKEFRDALKKAVTYTPPGVVNGTDLSIDILTTAAPKGFPTPFEGLNEKLHGIRKGEITTVCAASGMGKSTLIREIGKSLIDQKLSVANIMLENTVEEATGAYVALDMNIPMRRIRESPPDKSDMQTSWDKYVANGYTYYWDDFAGVNADGLIDIMRYYVKSKGADFILLDHLSMVISSTTSHNERKDIDTLMTKLAAFVVETGVGIIQVVHLNRNKDKSFTRGGEVDSTDLRGSAALEQLSWNIIAMERDQQSDERDFSVLRILKNRAWGYTGIADHLKYDTMTGRLASYKPEVPELNTTELTEEEHAQEESVS
jgi:twinkle protein